MKVFLFKIKYKKFKDWFLVVANNEKIARRRIRNAGFEFCEIEIKELKAGIYDDFSLANQKFIKK